MDRELHQEGREDWEVMPDRRKGLGVGRPLQRPGRGRESQDRSGDPPGGPGGVDRPSQRAVRSQEAFLQG